MKKMRKIVGLLLAMVMVFGMTATAFAATVENRTDHSYDAYQIFSGTQEAEENSPALGDIEWGTGVNGPDLLTALKEEPRFNVGDENANIFVNATEASDVAAVLEQYKDTDGIAEAFANLADLKRTNTVMASIAAEATSVELPAGYYLLVDTTVIDKPNDARNSALLQVTNDGSIVITKKYEVPTVDKSVKATADTDAAAGEAVDVSIGDSVTFTLTGTLPEKGLADYETYKYQFNDTLSNGLQYNGDAKVYLYIDGNTGNAEGGNKVDVTGSFTIAPASKPDTAGGTLTVSIDNLKDVLADNNGTEASKITVEYTAKLTAAAVIGSAGNPNTVKLIYSNNPNSGGEGDVATTTEDKVYVFTYKLDGSKVDGTDAGKKLPDAEFILYRVKKGETLSYDDKNVPQNVEYAQVGTDGKLTGWEATREQAMAAPLKSDANGSFIVEGLDAGTYYLEETKAPAGYNTLKGPVELTIAAAINNDAEAVLGETADPELQALTISTKDEEGNPQTTDGTVATGTVSLVVKNSAGVLLPSTGGMGTTLFYVVGAALILAAGALLVMKRRTGEGKQ